MRYYVTSDIHGFYTEFMESLKESGFFADHEEKKLIILGDLFDRGKEAVSLQNFILNMLQKDEVTLIRGNHEDLFMSLVTEDGGTGYSHHISNGTYETALQLTGFSIQDAYYRPFDFADAGVNTPYAKEIIPAMVDFFETSNYVFVHGWLPGYRDAMGYHYYENWRESDPKEWAKARWYNGMTAIQTTMEEKTIVCGHWHASFGHSRIEGKGSEFGPDADFTPYFGKGIIALDACTAVSKKVNCIAIED